MYRPGLSTSTALLIFCAVSRYLCLGAPTDPKQDVPKTMYEAVAKKCPVVADTNLNESDVFSKNCLDWAQINATSQLNESTKQNLRCLVYYNSLVSFCLDLEQDAKRLANVFIIDISKLVLKDNICSEKGSIYPINKTLEHDLEKLIPTQIDCLTLCFENPDFNNVCKGAYYFSKLNATALRNTLRIQSVKQQQLVPDNLKNKIPAIHNNTSVEAPKQAEVNIDKLEADVAPAIPDSTDNKSNQKKIPAVLSKPEHVLIDTENGPVNSAAAPVLNPVPAEAAVQKPAAPNQNSVETPGKVPDTQNTVEKPAKTEAQSEVTKDESKETKEKKKNDDDIINIEDVSPLGEEKSIPEEPPAEWGEEDQNEAEQEEETGAGNVKPENVEAADNNDGNSQKKKTKPNTVEDEINSFNTSEDDMDGDSYFFSYFTVLMCLCIVGYVGYHNRQKVLALILEGKKGRRSGRGRRPNSANYHKLDSNLEEAISSSCPKGSTNVIY